MFFQFTVGSLIIVATVVLHVGFTAAAEWMLKRDGVWPGPNAGNLRFVAVLVAVTLWLLVSICISVWIWSVCMLALGAFDDIERSIYFTLVSFTTLGFGDIILDEGTRILSGLMAANGLLIFGLTTAVLVDFLSRLKRQ